MVGGRGTLPSLGDSVPSLAPNPSATRADRRNVHSSSTKTTLSPRMHASTPTASSSTPHNTSLPVTIPRKAQQQPTSSVSPSPSTLSIPSLDLNTTSRDSSRTREGSSNSLRRPPGLSYPPQNESSLRVCRSCVRGLLWACMLCFLFSLAYALRSQHALHALNPLQSFVHYILSLS